MLQAHSLVIHYIRLHSFHKVVFGTLTNIIIIH